MNNPAKVKKEGLDKKIIKLIGYSPTCFLSGAMIAVSTTIAVYLFQYFNLSENFLDQLDARYDYIMPYLILIVPPSLFGGCLVGLAIGLFTTKIKLNWQKILASSAIGLIVYLLSSAIWRTVANGNIADSLDYLRFFALQLSFIGTLVGLLVALLPRPEPQS